MTILLALLGAVVGAVAGAAIGFFGVVAIGLLTGADNQQGALAIGAATVGLPLGAVIGAILGAWLVVLLRRRFAPAPGAGAAKATTGGIGRQGWIGLGLAAAAAAGFWTWFHWTGDPPQFRGASRPVLFVEIRVPADDPDIDAAVARGTDLRNGQVYHGTGGPMRRAADGAYVVLSSHHVIAYRTRDRSVELWLGQERLLIFDLDLARKPAEQPDFTAWRAVDEVRPNFYGAPIMPDGGHDIWIRTKVMWDGN